MLHRAGVLLLMASLPGLAQFHGFGYLAPGYAAAKGGSDDAFVHFGGGGEYVTHSGVGAGADIGGLGEIFGSTSVTLSVYGSYHFRRERKVDPFALAGYSGFYHRAATSFFGPPINQPSENLFHFGGGTNLWFSKHVGGLLEARDHLHSGNGPTVHYLELMLGLTFK